MNDAERLVKIREEANRGLELSEMGYQDKDTLNPAIALIYAVRSLEVIRCIADGYEPTKDAYE